MLDEVEGRELRVVERLAWHPSDGLEPNLHSGSVHLWFDGGRCAHFDAASDWTLSWSVTGPGDNDWLRQYDYEAEGRWLLRDASSEEPFAAVLGRRLVSTEPLFNDVDEVTGTLLRFDETELTLSVSEGELSAAPR